MTSENFPTSATVTDSLPYAQDKGQPLTVKLAWAPFHSGSFNLSLAHAVQLRNALDAKLSEQDAAALARIDGHLKALEANR